MNAEVRIGQRLVQEKMLWMLVRRWVMVVQRMGQEPRPQAWRHEGQTRRRRSRQNPIQATAANGAGLPEGAAIARRQNLRREATAPIEFSLRGTLRAVSGGSRLIRCNAKTSGRKL